MKIDVLTIFPEFFDAFLNTSIIKRAVEQNLVSIQLHQLRDYSHNKHKKIDDTPYGGGVGMLMQFPPFYDAISKLKQENTKVILLSPQGTLLNQAKAIELAKSKHQIILCGHYEGIDHRIEQMIDEEISVGDYVLTGGELPAMILIDAITRLIPEVINESSVNEDSLQQGWLKYPQYTKPESYQGYDVPSILLSGNHKNIDQWRKIESIKSTYKKRPDLIQKITLSKDEIDILDKIKKEK